jgi:hypothetical protein
MIKFLEGTSQHLWKYACGALAMVAIALVLLTAYDYGDSWDESIRAAAGEEKLAYYQNLLSGNFSSAKAMAVKKDLYPGFHDLNLAVLRRISPLSDHATGNLFSAFLGLVGLLGAMFLARQLWNMQAAFWTGLLLLSSPTWYGHLFINPKDIPFGTAYIWSIISILAWIRRIPKPGWIIPVTTGFAIGIAAACRIGGLVLFCYLVLFIAVTLVSQGRVRTLNLRQLLKQLRVQAFSLGLAGVLCAAVLLLYWPYGQWAPFTHAGETLQAVSAYDWTMPVLFEGHVYNAKDLPLLYIVKIIIIKTPLLLLLSFTAGILIIIHQLKSGSERPGEPAPGFMLLCLLFTIVFPVAYVILKDSVLYNGMRHMLFILPPMCVLAGIAIEWIFRMIHLHLPMLRLPLYIGLLGMSAFTVAAMIRLHPYQYIYYNELAGGTVQASKRYETDYWGTAYRELAQKLADYLNSREGMSEDDEIVINMEHVTWLFTPFLAKATHRPFTVVRASPKNDDFYVSSTTWMADQFYYGSTIAEVSRMGVCLGVIKDRRGLSDDERVLGYQPDGTLVP